MKALYGDGEDNRAKRPSSQAKSAQRTEEGTNRKPLPCSVTLWLLLWKGLKSFFEEREVNSILNEIAICVPMFICRKAISYKIPIGIHLQIYFRMYEVVWKGRGMCGCLRNSGDSCGIPCGVPMELIKEKSACVFVFFCYF